MRPNYQNHYVVNEDEIAVKMQEKLVSLDFRPFTSSQKLNRLYTQCKPLVSAIKADYLQHFKQELHISDASFLAEIWGHLVAYKLSLWLKKHLNFSPIKQLAKLMAFRSAIIDCGERHKDSNRWLWDLIARLFF